MRTVKVRRGASRKEVVKNEEKNKRSGEKPIQPPLLLDVIFLSSKEKKNERPSSLL